MLKRLVCLSCLNRQELRWPFLILFILESSVDAADSFALAESGNNVLN